MKNKYLNGFFNEPQSDAQRKFIGGRLSFYSDEASITKLCEQIVEFGAMYRACGEKYVRLDIMRNEGKKTEFSIMRSDWSKDGSLKEKIDAYESKGDQDTTISPDPIDDDDELGF